MQMFTPAVIFLTIANTLAASGAIFAAWQISFFELGRKQQPTEATASGNAAEQTGPVEDRELRHAA
jgi:hypothetical protein